MEMIHIPRIGGNTLIYLEHKSQDPADRVQVAEIVIIEKQFYVSIFLDGSLEDKIFDKIEDALDYCRQFLTDFFDNYGRK